MHLFNWLLGSTPTLSQAYLSAASLFSPNELATLKQQFHAHAEGQGLDQRHLLVSDEPLLRFLWSLMR